MAYHYHLIILAFLTIMVQGITASGNQRGEENEGDAGSPRYSVNSYEMPLELYHKIAGMSEYKDGNLFVSPASLSLLMGTAYAGATGKTQSEIGKVFHWNDLNDALTFPRSLLDGQVDDSEKEKNSSEKKSRILNISTRIWYQYNWILNRMSLGR